jgi:hypothetical protein
MKVQHAPSPVQADFESPEIVACVTAHSTKGGTVTAKNASTASVSTALALELKKFRRSQSMLRGPTPVVVPGGNWSTAAVARPELEAFIGINARPTRRGD